MNKPINIDNIMKRIKENLDNAQKNRNKINPHVTKEIGYQDYDQKLIRLFVENEQNNRKWNVNTEYNITSHRLKTGKFIVMGKKIIRKLLRWYINPAFDKQREFNGGITRTFNIMIEITQNIVNDLKSIVKQESNALNKEFEERLIVVENNLIDLKSTEIQEMIEKAVVNSMQEIQKNTEYHYELELEKIKNYFRDEFVHNKELTSGLEVSVNDLNSGLINISQEHDKNLKLTMNRIEQLDDMIILTNARLKKMERGKEKLKESIKTQFTNKEEINEKINDSYKLDYFLFEQKFRGTRASIIERQKYYLPYFIGKTNILDIGCGRGEFIELLQKEGSNVKGLDLNSDMVDYCQGRGFDVELEDAIIYLKGISDNTFDGIFMAQVIEHLNEEQSMILLDDILRVLRPGGVVAIETINAQSVYAMSNWFYMDPTHIKPVHPVTLEFVMQGIGFSNVEIKYLSPVADKAIPKLNIVADNIEEFNNSIQDLNGFIYGHQDYAILAYK